MEALNAQLGANLRRQESEHAAALAGPLLACLAGRTQGCRARGCGSGGKGGKRDN